MDYTEFSKRIKTKYPEYADVDDRKLAERVISKYPEYKGHVEFPQAVGKSVGTGVDVAPAGEGEGKWKDLPPRRFAPGERPPGAISYPPDKTWPTKELTPEKKEQVKRIGAIQDRMLKATAQRDKVPASEQEGLVRPEGMKDIGVSWAPPPKQKPEIRVPYKQPGRGITPEESEQIDLISEAKYLRENAPFEMKAQAATTELIRKSPVGIIARTITGDKFLPEDKTLKSAFPYYSMAGEMAGRMISLYTAGKILGTTPTKLIPFRVADTATAVRIASAVMGGAKFGLAQFGEEVAKSREQGKIKPGESLTNISESIAFGGMIGTTALMKDVIAASAASGVFAGSVAYAKTKDVKNALISGTMMSLFTAITHKDSSKYIRDIAYQKTRLQMADIVKSRKPSLSEKESQKLADRLVNAVLNKMGAFREKSPAQYKQGPSGSWIKTADAKYEFSDKIDYKFFDNFSKNIALAAKNIVSPVASQPEALPFSGIKRYQAAAPGPAAPAESVVTQDIQVTPERMATIEQKIKTGEPLDAYEKSAIATHQVRLKQLLSIPRDTVIEMIDSGEMNDSDIDDYIEVKAAVPDFVGDPIGDPDGTMELIGDGADAAFVAINTERFAEAEQIIQKLAVGNMPQTEDLNTLRDSTVQGLTSLLQSAVEVNRAELAQVSDEELQSRIEAKKALQEGKIAVTEPEIQELKARQGREKEKGGPTRRAAEQRPRERVLTEAERAETEPRGVTAEYFNKKPVVTEEQRAKRIQHNKDIIARGFPQEAETTWGEKVTILGVAGKTGRKGEALGKTFADLSKESGQIVIRSSDGSETITMTRSILPVKPTVAKEPWEMTNREYIDNWISTLPKDTQAKWRDKTGKYDVAASNVERQKSDEHLKIIKKAISDGKSVPAEVLADYPDLAKPPRPGVSEGEAPDYALQEESLFADTKKHKNRMVLKFTDDGIPYMYELKNVPGVGALIEELNVRKNIGDDPILIIGDISGMGDLNNTYGRKITDGVVEKILETFVLDLGGKGVGKYKSVVGSPSGDEMWGIMHKGATLKETMDIISSFLDKLNKMEHEIRPGVVMGFNGKFFIARGTSAFEEGESQLKIDPITKQKYPPGTIIIDKGIDKTDKNIVVFSKKGGRSDEKFIRKRIEIPGRKKTEELPEERAPKGPAEQRPQKLTTAQARTKAQEAEKRLDWESAARLWNQAIQNYPEGAGELREKDIRLLKRSLRSAERALADSKAESVNIAMGSQRGAERTLRLGVEEINKITGARKDLIDRFQKHIPTGDLDYGEITIKDYKDAAAVIALQRRPDIEQFIFIPVDKNGKPLSSPIVINSNSNDSVSRVLIEAKKREIKEKFKPAKIWSGHNHPSGNEKMSPEDYTLAVEVLADDTFAGHIITDHNKYTLLNPVSGGIVAETHDHKAGLEDWRGYGASITSPGHVANAITGMLDNNIPKTAVMLLSSDNKILAVETVDNDIAESAGFTKVLRDLKKTYAAPKYAIVSNRGLVMPALNGKNQLPAGLLDIVVQEKDRAISYKAEKRVPFYFVEPSVETPGVRDVDEGEYKEIDILIESLAEEEQRVMGIPTKKEINVFLRAQYAAEMAKYEALTEGGDFIDKMVAGELPAIVREGYKRGGYADTGVIDASRAYFTPGVPLYKSGEWASLSQSVKRRAFSKKGGAALDEVADALGMTDNELFDKLVAYKRPEKPMMGDPGEIMRYLTTTGEGQTELISLRKRVAKQHKRKVLEEKQKLKQEITKGSGMTEPTPAQHTEVAKGFREIAMEEWQKAHDENAGLLPFRIAVLGKVDPGEYRFQKSWKNIDPKIRRVIVSHDEGTPTLEEMTVKLKIEGEKGVRGSAVAQMLWELQNFDVAQLEKPKQSVAAYRAEAYDYLLEPEGQQLLADIRDEADLLAIKTSLEKHAGLWDDTTIRPFKSSSAAFNEHYEYFKSLQLPALSHIRAIQKKIQETNGKRLAGTIGADEANRRIIVLRKFLYETAKKEGVAVRTTKEGRVTIAVRKAGPWVPEEFTGAKFVDVSEHVGGYEDITRLIQRMDGSLTVAQKVPMKGQAGMLERYVLWRSRKMSMQHLNWVNEKLRKGIEIFKGVKKNSAKDIEITDALRETEPHPEATVADIRLQANQLRNFFNETINEQNAMRRIRRQPLIKYRLWYSPEIMRDITMWERFGMIGKKVKEIMSAADLPDYVFPNKPYNARELAREHGIPYEDRILSAIKLMELYIVSAGQDIFNTSIIQNNKAFIQQLESLGYKNSANSLGAWTAEAYAGIKPQIDRTFKVSPGVSRVARKFNSIRNMGVFPLNFSWSLLTQTSSFALTIGRYGAINSMRGMLDYLDAHKLQMISKTYYSYVVKASDSGAVTQQDAGNRLARKMRIYTTPQDMINDWSTIFLEEIEKALTAISIQAAYYDGKSRGLEGEALLNFASDGGGKTQSMYNDEDKPRMLRALTVKTLAPFQTFNFEVMNTLREWAGKTGTPPDTKMAAIWTLIRFLAACSLFSTIAKRLANKEVWSWSRPPLPFSEFWFSPIYKKLAGEYAGNAAGLTSPVQSATSIAQGINDWLDAGDTRRIRNELIRYGAGFFGIPGGGQISRTVDTLIAYSKGGLYDKAGKRMFKVETPQDLAQGVFSGVWTTKGGREYLEKRTPAARKKRKEEKEAAEKKGETSTGFKKTTFGKTSFGKAEKWGVPFSK